MTTLESGRDHSVSSQYSLHECSRQISDRFSINAMVIFNEINLICERYYYRPLAHFE